MEKAIQNVLGFYQLTARLKSLVRTGWKQWEISADRVESVAEHVYGCCMLAVAIQSEFQYKIDLNRVIFMLAVHELEETIIGDLTPFQAAKDNQKEIGAAAVAKILGGLTNAKTVAELINEFEDQNTPESKFAKMVDKLDGGLQCKLYDLGGFIDPANPNIAPARRANLKARGYDRLSDSWLERCIESYGFDETFVKIARAARVDGNWESN